MAPAVECPGRLPNWDGERNEYAQLEMCDLTKRMPMRYPAVDMAMGRHAPAVHHSFFGLYKPMSVASKKSGSGDWSEMESRMQFANRWKRVVGRM